MKHRFRTATAAILFALTTGCAGTATYEYCDPDGINCVECDFHQHDTDGNDTLPPTILKPKILTED